MIYSKYSEKKDEEETVINPAPQGASLNSNPESANATSTESTSTEFRPQSVINISSSFISVNQSSSSPSSTPYINRASLSSLDFTYLERNIQIRHDLMLERGYRAALPKYAVTSDELDEYWRLVQEEFVNFAANRAECTPKLHMLITEIRELMTELYPKCELVTKQLSEILEDPDHVIQQLKLGLFDYRSFFEFLGQVMKKNCAPKRDVLVDALMACDCPITGLKACLHLIELMKLDLANYRLDQLRPQVAKCAVSTERAFFAQLFSNGKLSLDLTKRWLLSGRSTNTEAASVCTAFERFIDAYLQLLVNPFVQECSVPETFILDKKRLIRFHSKFQDLCIVQCLLLIFKQAQGASSRPALAVSILRKELLGLLENPDTQISDISDLLISTLKQGDVYEGNIENRFDFIRSAINRVIAPDNEMFLLVEKRLQEHIKASILKDPHQSQNRFGHLNVLEEIDVTMRDFVLLIQYNWSVFEPIYKEIAHEC